MFGNNFLFVLRHPKDKELIKQKEEAEKAGKVYDAPEQTFEKAQEEIAQNSGLLNYGDLTQNKKEGSAKSAGMYWEVRKL